MTEIEIHRDEPSNSLVAQMDYARAVSTANLLPQAYRGKPADIMLAVGLGQSMGLSPAESLYRIDVIQGKPTASAELIAANVRKAGHKLRLRVDEQAVSATCTIIRADDPDYEHTVTRDAAWAKRMGLDGKDNYKKQPATMLGWRAITACARMACPEALYGVAYTADEMGDLGERREETRSGLGAVLGATATTTAEQVNADEELSAGETMLDPRSALGKRMFAAMGEAGVTEKADRLALCSEVAGREITTSSDLTEDEARRVIAEVTGAES